MAATDYELRRALAGKACISLERFCDTARACALISRRLDLLPPEDDLYAIGLFHDCGFPPMAMCIADYRDFLEQANQDYQRVMIVTESDRYRLNHAQVGHTLADSWNIPTKICQVILQHHEPDDWEQLPEPRTRQALAVLKLAEQIVDRHRRGTDNIDWQRSRESVAEILGLGNDALSVLMEEVARELAAQIAPEDNLDAVR